MQEMQSEDPTPFWKRRRYFVVMMAFFGLFNVYALRINMSVAIVDMTDFKNVTHEDGSVHLEQRFPWNSVEKGYILSSFFYGYLCTQIIGGIIANRIGGNLVRLKCDVNVIIGNNFCLNQLFGIGVGVTAIFTLITPAAANLGIWALIAVRVIEGFFEVSSEIILPE